MKATPLKLTPLFRDPENNDSFAGLSRGYPAPKCYVYVVFSPLIYVGCESTLSVQ